MHLDRLLSSANKVSLRCKCVKRPATNVFKEYHRIARYLSATYYMYLSVMTTPFKVFCAGYSTTVKYNLHRKNNNGLGGVE